jgi:hypothetical protein
MSAHTLFLLPEADFVIAAATRVLIRTWRKREDTPRREDCKNVASWTMN